MLVVDAVKINDTFITCRVPVDFSDLAPVELDIRIGFFNDPKTIS